MSSPQRGVQDYELAQRVRQRGEKGEQALEEIHARLVKVASPVALYPERSVAPGKLYSLKHEDYEWARRRMLEVLAGEGGLDKGRCLA